MKIIEKLAIKYLLKRGYKVVHKESGVNFIGRWSELNKEFIVNEGLDYYQKKGGGYIVKKTK